MKRVLVTGANGFIGRPVVAALVQAGWDVHALGRGVPAEAGADAPGSYRYHQVDLMNAAAVHDCLAAVRATHLLHLAWDTDPATYRSSTANFDWVAASLDLLRVFHGAGGQRAVLAGSCAEYDWRYGYCREALTPLRPDTTYGRCKHALAELSLAYAQQCGLSLAWGRVFFLYGPHEPAARLVPTVIRALLRGEQAGVTSGEQLRDFLYVADVAAAFTRLLEVSLDGCVNIASGVPVEVRHLIGLVADALDGHERLRFGAIARAHDDPPLIAGDNTQLRACGWRPRFDLATGLATTIDWWRTRTDAAASGVM